MHKHSEVVTCKTEEDVKKLASEMKEACLAPFPEYEKSDNPILNQWRALTHRPTPLERGQVRCLSYKNIVFSIFLSIENGEVSDTWQLSIASLGINRNDLLIREIVEMFLGDGYEEIQNPTNKTRLFIKETSAGLSE